MKEITFEETDELIFKTKWKTSACGSGDECWCRIIEPESKIEYPDGTEAYIVGSGAIPKEYAEYIVKLHNKNLEDGKNI